MRERKLLSALQDAGLTEKEAAVYFAALTLGPATVLRIARSSGLKRTTVYSVVESLRQKGLMAEEIRGFRKVYTAEPPERLSDLIEARKTSFSLLLPEFAALYKFPASEGTIKFFEGIGSMKEVYEGLLRDIGPDEDYMIVSNMHHWYYADASYFQDFTERRAALSRKLGFRIRLLLQDSEISRKHRKIQAQLNETIRLLPKHTSLTTNLVIIPKKVVIHQLVPPIHAMVVENPNIVRMHRELFEIMWGALA